MAVVVAGTLLLFATGRMDVYADLARGLFAWGGDVLPGVRTR